MKPVVAVPPNAIGGTWGRVAKLGIGGGAAFWLANLAISLTPVAADYRAAVSIAYLPMLGEALAGGLIIGFGVAYCLLRFYDRLPTTNPVLKSLVLSLTALVVLTVLIEVPAKIGLATGDALHYLIVAAVFNVLRFSALGTAVGLLAGRDRR